MEVFKQRQGQHLCVGNVISHLGANLGEAGPFRIVGSLIAQLSMRFGAALTRNNLEAVSNRTNGDRVNLAICPNILAHFRKSIGINFEAGLSGIVVQSIEVNVLHLYGSLGGHFQLGSQRDLQSNSTIHWFLEHWLLLVKWAISP